MTAWNESQRHAVAHARYCVDRATPEAPEVGFDYTLVQTLLDLIEPQLRPLDEWHEDMGPVLWWSLPIEEPPYVGTPLDIGRTIEISLRTNDAAEHRDWRTDLCGWPGYHTHWTPLPKPPKQPFTSE